MKDINMYLFVLAENLEKSSQQKKKKRQGFI